MVTSAVSSSTLDVNSIVSQLMQVESRPLTNLQNRQSALQSKISAYGAIKSAFSATGDAMARLSAPLPFNTLKAVSSNDAAVSASAGAKTTPGTYNVDVTQLAQAQKLSSSAFASTDASIGSGTLNFQFGAFASGAFTANGAQPAFSVVIAPGQDTLTGIRDAINQANGGVRASIVNDGSGFRLALASTITGAANSLKITTTDADAAPTDNAGLSQLAYDPAATAGSGRNLTQTAAAQNALLTIDGVSVSKSSNTVTDAIDGLSLNLIKTTGGTPAGVTISKDSTAVKAALDDFVKAYNNFNTMVKNFTGFNPATRTASLLTGDATVNGLLSRLKESLNTAIPGYTGTPSRLSDVGVSFGRDGTLAFDGAVFDKAAQNPAFSIAPLFAATGTPDDSRVEYLSGGTTTPAGRYAVNVTQAATRGSLVASAAAGLTITSGVNDSLTLLADGISAQVTLAPGTYTAAALSAELQSRINGASALRQAGITLSVSQTGGLLTLRSDRYGATSGVAAPSGNAALSLFGGAPVSSSGSNVAGTIGGGAATGSGQSLTTSTGLTLKIAPDVSGAFGQVDFNRGYASRIASMVGAVVKTDGAIASRTDGLNRSVQDLQKQQTRLTDRLSSIETALRRQYTALDGNLSRMNTTSLYLTQQIAQIQANK
jgi:flagellar hook-associated protein 2